MHKLKIRQGDWVIVCDGKKALSAVNAGLVKSLILIAPPRALGVLRQAYSHNLRAAVRAEIDKTSIFPCMRSKSISRSE